MCHVGCPSLLVPQQMLVSPIRLLLSVFLTAVGGAAQGLPPVIAPPVPKATAASKKAMIAADADEAARLAADINKRVVTGPLRKSKTAGATNVNEKIIPLFESPAAAAPLVPVLVNTQPNPI